MRKEYNNIGKFKIEFSSFCKEHKSSFDDFELYFAPVAKQMGYKHKETGTIFVGPQSMFLDSKYSFFFSSDHGKKFILKHVCEKYSFPRV